MGWGCGGDLIRSVEWRVRGRGWGVELAIGVFLGAWVGWFSWTCAGTWIWENCWV